MKSGNKHTGFNSGKCLILKCFAVIYIKIFAVAAEQNNTRLQYSLGLGYMSCIHILLKCIKKIEYHNPYPIHLSI